VKRPFLLLPLLVLSTMAQNGPSKAQSTHTAQLSFNKASEQCMAMVRQRFIKLTIWPWSGTLMDGAKRLYHQDSNRLVLPLEFDMPGMDTGNGEAVCGVQGSSVKLKSVQLGIKRYDFNDDGSVQPDVLSPNIATVGDTHYKRFGIEKSWCTGFASMEFPGMDFPAWGGMVCEALAVVKTRDGKLVKFHLACSMRWATCQRFKIGEVFQFEEVPDGQYRECGVATEEKACLKIIAKPHDAIYASYVVMAEQP
jgi:hypothetical protein